MLNVNKITSQLATMSDQALQQFAGMHKADPYMLSLAVAESNRRKEMRVASQGQPTPEPPKVVDQAVAGMAPENAGIGQLPMQSVPGMAGGGIVAFADGGSAEQIPRYEMPEDFPYDPVVPVSDTERNITNIMLGAPGVGPARGAGALMRVLPYPGMLLRSDEKRPEDKKSKKNVNKSSDRGERSGISQLTPQQIEQYVKASDIPEEPVEGTGLRTRRMSTNVVAPRLSSSPVPRTAVPGYDEMAEAVRKGATTANEETAGAYRPFEELLKAERAKIEGKDNTKDALIRAGLGMLASKSPYALQGIGEGAIQGFDVYQAAKKADQEAIKANTQAQMLLMQAQRAERSGNMRNATDLYGQHRQAVRDAAGYDQKAQELKDTEAYRNADLQIRQQQVNQQGDYWKAMGAAKGGNRDLATLKAQQSSIQAQLKADPTMQYTEPQEYARLTQELRAVTEAIAQQPGGATMKASPGANDPLGIR